MTDKKLILRVGLKLMAIIAVSTLAYIFFSGLLTSQNPGKEISSVMLDISDIKPGKIKYYKVLNKKLLVLHRTQSMLDELDRLDESLFKQRSTDNLALEMNEQYRSHIANYFVAYAYEPFYGCEIKLLKNIFVPVCIDIKYNLAGRVFRSSRAENNLIVPKYKVLKNNHIKIYLD